MFDLFVCFGAFRYFLLRDFLIVCLLVLCVSTWSVVEAARLDNLCGFGVWFETARAAFSLFYSFKRASRSHAKTGLFLSCFGVLFV